MQNSAITRRKSLLLFGASSLALALPAEALAAAAAKGAVTPDPLFNQPYIDVDEWRDKPVRHRYVHGGFKGTDARFVFYMPPREQYQGRFFQYITPVPVAEDQVYNEFGNDNPLPFAFDSGAFAVGSNQGGKDATGVPGSPVDPTIAGFRVSAATAEYARVVANKMYGHHRTYGYCYGGSGGAFRTIGCVENTTAWDGSVVFVMGSPMAIPNVFTVRCHALRILKDKFPQIVDAAEPGGSGDLYAGLNAEEQGALTELLKMGFPKKALAYYRTMGIGAFAILFDIVRAADPTYFTQFWTVPGYLGANPPPSLVAARVQHRTTVTRVVMSNEAAAAGVHAPATGGAVSADADTAWQNLQKSMGGAPFAVAFQLREPPPSGGDLTRGAIHIRSGAAAGQSVALSGMDGNFALLNFTSIGTVGKPSQMNVAAGDEIEIDNSDYLASQTYHRHQVPGHDYPVWDQFRNADGTPKYPQRPFLLGPTFQVAAGGALPTARFNGKMIVVESMMDYDAFPWQADWYRKKVEEVFGAKTDDHYRLWMVENAIHGGPNTARAINYATTLQQALRDVAAWAEHDASPAPTTEYVVDDGQIVVPPAAEKRKGIQPVVKLAANGGARAEVRVGEAVSFSVSAQTPRRTGSIVEVLWDFDGSGAFAESSAVTPAPNVTVGKTHTFTQPGTYFVGARVASHRKGNQNTPFAKLYNLDRVRVVVS